MWDSSEHSFRVTRPLVGAATGDPAAAVYFCEIFGFKVVAMIRRPRPQTPGVLLSAPHIHTRVLRSNGTPGSLGAKEPSRNAWYVAPIAAFAAAGGACGALVTTRWGDMARVDVRPPTALTFYTRPNAFLRRSTLNHVGHGAVDAGCGRGACAEATGAARAAWQR